MRRSARTHISPTPCLLYQPLISKSPNCPPRPKESKDEPGECHEKDSSKCSRDGGVICKLHIGKMGEVLVCIGNIKY